MKIGSLPMTDQMRMIRGVENVVPKGNKGERVADGEGGEKASFVNMLTDKMKEVNELGLIADEKMAEAVAGKSANPHEAIIAMQKADISFKLLMSIKMQIEQAYQQIVMTQL